MMAAAANQKLMMPLAENIKTGDSGRARASAHKEHPPE